MRRRIRMPKLNCEIALLLPAALPYLTGAISGSLAAVADCFPNASGLMVRLIGSVSSISSIACGIISSILIKQISTKKILLGYLFLSFLGGLLAFIFSDHIYMLMIASVLTGFSGGLIPICAITIDQLYSGDQEYTLLSSQYSVCCFGGIVIMLISSVLSMFGFRYVYILFLLIIPVFLLVEREVEEIPANKEEKKSEKSGIDIRKAVTLSFVVCCLFSMLYYAADHVWSLNFSFVLSSILGGKNRFGNIPNVVSCLGGFIAGNPHTKIYKRFKEKTFLVGTLILLFGLLTVAVFPTSFTVFVCGFCSGFSMSVTLPYVSAWASETVEEQYSSFAIAIVNMFINMGAFLTPFIFGTEGKIFPQAGLIRPFRTASLVCVLLCLFWLMFHKGTKAVK